MRGQWPELSNIWKQLKIIGNNLHGSLKYVYLVYAISLVLLTVTITPGFQSPDEHSHFIRVEQISRGVFVGTFISQLATREHRTSPDGRIVYPDSGGYFGNRGILLSAHAYQEINFNPENKVTKSMIDSSKMYAWTPDLVLFLFPNTVIYPPTGYFFPVIGTLFGKWLHMTVFDTLILSRILNGIGCIIICFFALSLATRCRLLLFSVLLLPLTISIFASVNQDAMLISLASLMVGLIDHTESGENRKYTTAQLILLIFCITAISAAKPPYFLLIFVFLFLHIKPRLKLYCIAIPFIIVLTWGLLNLDNYSVAWAPAEMKINTNLQMAYVMSHPIKFIGLFFHWNMYEIMIKMYEFIGILGWLDVVLPSYYYKMAYILLFLTTISLFQRSPEKLKFRMVFVFAYFTTFIAILTAQYITWQALESPSLGGIQARYFIPIFPFLAIGIAGFGKEQVMKNWQMAIFLLAVLFPLMTQIVMVNSYILRYYLN